MREAAPTTYFVLRHRDFGGLHVMGHHCRHVFDNMSRLQKKQHEAFEATREQIAVLTRADRAGDLPPLIEAAAPDALLLPQEGVVGPLHRVLALLRANRDGAPQRQIYSALGLPPSVVNQALQRLANKGRVLPPSVRGGNWTLGRNISNPSSGKTGQTLALVLAIVREHEGGIATTAIAKILQDRGQLGSRATVASTLSRLNTMGAVIKGCAPDFLWRVRV